MVQAAQNNVYIKVAHKYIANLSSILKLASIENNSSVDPSDLVQIIGEVVSIPKTITTEKRGYEGFSAKDIRVGDTAIFRYDLIYNFVKQTPEGDPVYKNRIWHDGQELWCCDIQKIFGVIRDGEIIMINGYVMLSDFVEPKIVLAAHARKVRNAQKSEIMHIGGARLNENPISAVQGDTVFYNPNLAAKYQIKGKPFRIIQQSKILGKEVM